MTVYTVTVHHTEHPETWHVAQFALHAVAVLVNLAHLRNKAGPCLHSNLLDDFSRAQRRGSCGIIELVDLVSLWNDGVRCGGLPPDVDTAKVCALLQARVILKLIDLYQIAPLRRVTQWILMITSSTIANGVIDASFCGELLPGLVATTWSSVLLQLIRQVRIHIALSLVLTHFNGMIVGE